jgi:hypothetical protein
VSAITVILEPDSDGCLHLPAPAELRGNKVKVVAYLETVESGDVADRATLIRGEFGRSVLVAPPQCPADDRRAGQGNPRRRGMSHLLDVNLLAACA